MLQDIGPGGGTTFWPPYSGYTTLAWSPHKPHLQPWLSLVVELYMMLAEIPHFTSDPRINAEITQQELPHTHAYAHTYTHTVV